MNYEEVIEVIKLNKRDIEKVTFHRHLLIIIMANEELTIVTTNWTNAECHIVIKELNTMFNSSLTSATKQNAIAKKLEELKIV